MDFFPSLPIENLFLMEVVLKYRSPFFDLSNIILQERYAKQTRLRVSFGVEMYDSTSIWKIRLNRISCGLMQRNRIYAIHDRVLHISTPCCRVLVICGRSRLCQGLFAYILIDKAMQVACPTSPDTRGRDCLPE